MFDKIDISGIVNSHLDSLRDDREGPGRGRSKSDLALFFLLPSILGISLGILNWFSKFGYRIEAINGILNVSAILVGLLLNLLVLVFTLAVAPTPVGVDFFVRRRFMREIFSGLCFCILLALGLIVTSMVDLSYLPKSAQATTGPISTTIITAVTVSFFLHILMLLKRMFAVFNKETKNLPTVGKAA